MRIVVKSDLFDSMRRLFCDIYEIAVVSEEKNVMKSLTIIEPVMVTLGQNI